MEYVLALLASILAGFINTLSGSGSLIMIPLLMWMGLPAPIANGTNRVAIVFQSIVGVRTYFKNTSFQIGSAWWVIIPSVIGAILGAIMATQTSPDVLKEFIGILMIVMLFVILMKPGKWLKDHQKEVESFKDKTPLSIILMFFVGIYGGFIQGGVGIFLLACMVLISGYGVNFSNAIKLFIVFMYAIPVLIVFIIQKQVNWELGLFTAIGQSLGAYIGARFATQHPKANLWTFRLLIVVITASIIEFYDLHKMVWNLFQ